jgi:hypothetical protein
VAVELGVKSETSPSLPFIYGEFLFLCGDGGAAHAKLASRAQKPARQLMRSLRVRLRVQRNRAGDTHAGPDGEVTTSKRGRPQTCTFG